MQGTESADSWTLPAGGTWRVFRIDTNTSDFHAVTEDLPGGTVQSSGTRCGGVAIRVAL